MQKARKSHDADPRPPFVEAPVSYVGPTERRPRFFLQDPGKDRNLMEQVIVQIRDARPRLDEFRLDTSGFELFEYPTALKDHRDPEEVRRVYRPELERALRELTGASTAIITTTVFVRSGNWSRQTSGAGTTYPARYVHSDCTERTGPAIVRGLTALDDPKRWANRRYAIYSMWRVFSPPPQDMPIAMCDARSVTAADVVPCDVVTRSVGREVIYEGMSFRHSRAHQWYYFRDMRPEEMLLIKAYDSDPGRAWRVPHTGFKDVTAPSGTVPRASIDIRAVAFFD